MKNVNSFFALACAVGFLSISCSKDSDKNPPEGGDLSGTELQFIMEADKTSGALDSALADLYLNPEESTSKLASECYSAVYTETGYTATFNNCYLNGTENINGSLNVVYSNDAETATFTATYTDFYVGEIKLNGSRTFSLAGDMEGNSFTLEVSSAMEVILADETEIAETGSKTLVFTFGQTLASSTFEIDGNWTVIADGTTYSVAVTELLQGNFSCAHLVSGLMDISKNGLEVSVDFGDGGCDDLATVIYPNGAVEEISLKD